jgi:hypothetical protein
MNPSIILPMNPTVFCTNWGTSKVAPNEPEPLRMNPRIILRMNPTVFCTN